MLSEGPVYHNPDILITYINPLKPYDCKMFPACNTFRPFFLILVCPPSKKSLQPRQKNRKGKK